MSRKDSDMRAPGNLTEMTVCVLGRPVGEIFGWLVVVKCIVKIQISHLKAGETGLRIGSKLLTLSMPIGAWPDIGIR